MGVMLWCNIIYNIKQISKPFDFDTSKGSLFHRRETHSLTVIYHLCIQNTLGTVFELHQSSENVHHYFHIIKTKNMYRLSYTAKYYCLLVICVCLKTFVDI